MAYSSAIEWTDATWNPVTGCTKISAGCDNCYAERFAERFRGVPGHPFENGFDLQLRPERLEQPLRWREAKMIFVNSMSDLFHKQIPFSFVDRVFDTLEKAHWHKFQIHWVIVGGESGPRARPMLVEWPREVRDQCKAAKVPFFFKQWGGLRPKSGGRLLDGREWSQWPNSYANNHDTVRGTNDGSAKADDLAA
jgi:protein gp37